MFLHFAIEIKNKEQIYNFFESSMSHMQRFEEQLWLASSSLATHGIYIQRKYINISAAAGYVYS